LPKRLKPGQPLRIYIAGPYSADTPKGVRQNVLRASRVAQELCARGHIPFCPHSHSHGWEADGRLIYGDFMRVALMWLSQCEAVYFIGPSPGANRELEVAQNLGFPVYRSLDEVPKVEGYA
jgi:hypothetical protein